MDDSRRVNDLHAAGDLGGDPAGAGGVQGAAFQKRGQRVARHHLHHQVGQSVRKQTEVLDVHDVGMAQLGGELGFAKETLEALAAAVLAHHLDGQRRAQDGVTGRIDDAHAALVDDPLKMVALGQDRADKVVIVVAGRWRERRVRRCPRTDVRRRRLDR